MSQIPALARTAKTVDDYDELVDEQKASSSALQDLGLLLLRIFHGGLLAGHSSQKLFGMFGGYGLKGTAGWLESIGLKPGKAWAIAAGGGEFGGGLEALGLLHPLGEIATISAMAMATGKAHWGKPIWAAEGGPELAIINMAISTTLIFTGPGRFSLDRMLGIKVPPWISVLAALGAAGAVAYGINVSKPLPTASDQGPMDAERA